MPKYRDGYDPHSPKLDKSTHREVLNENIGRVIEGEDNLCNVFVVKKQTDARVNNVTLIDETGEEVPPLSRGVCRHCGSSLGDEGHGRLGNSAKQICSTCHAWIPIP